MSNGYSAVHNNVGALQRLKEHEKRAYAQLVAHVEERIRHSAAIGKKTQPLPPSQEISRLLRNDATKGKDNTWSSHRCDVRHLLTSSLRDVFDELKTKPAEEFLWMSLAHAYNAQVSQRYRVLCKEVHDAALRAIHASSAPALPSPTPTDESASSARAGVTSRSGAPTLGPSGINLAPQVTAAYLLLEEVLTMRDESGWRQKIVRALQTLRSEPEGV